MLKFKVRRGRHLPGHPEVAADVLVNDREDLIFPMADDSEGWLSQVNKPKRLSIEFVTAELLSASVLTCLNVSEVSFGHVSEDVPPFLQASGAKSYRAFAKAHQNVYVEVPEGGDSLTVQFWPRNASFMFVGPPVERPDLPVVMPVDASAVVVGAAVLQVLKAGEVDITDHFDGDSDAAVELGGDDDSLGYCDFKTGLLSDLTLSRPTCDGVVEVVTWLFDETAKVVAEQPGLFVCAVVTCALVCFRQGFLPDYLDGPVRQLSDISGQLAGEDLGAYREDVRELDELLTAGYVVVESPCPPDFFPGTWVESRGNLAWWNGLLRGEASGVG